MQTLAIQFLTEPSPIIAAFCSYIRRTSSPGAETWSRYRSTLTRFERLSGIGVLSATTETVDAYLLAMMQPDGMFPSTARTVWATLRSFCAWAVSMGVMASNPVASIPPPRMEQKLPQYLSQEAVQRVLTAPPSWTIQGVRDRALLSVLYGCGLRISEAIRLRLQDVDLERGNLVVRRGKGGRLRGLPIPPTTVEKLQRYLDVRARFEPPSGEASLWLARFGRPLQSFRARVLIEKAFEIAGEEGTPHTLRHCFATHHLEAGDDIRIVQDLLGHVSSVSTMIYLHTAPERLRASQTRFVA